MNTFRFAASAVLIFSIAISTCSAQDLLSQRALSLDAAQAIAEGALQKCRAGGYKVSISVLDANGTMKAFLRDDGNGPHTIDLSRRKAYTALTYKRTSAETGKAYAAMPQPPNIEGIVGLGGGVPIRAGNEVIGAIGVSGAPAADLDEACANAGIAKLADKLK